ncbi:V-type proton ATPase subunit G, putative [Plasmodium vinckei]|uniref:V-type proton ATPase subunit G, putative n=1 Tax=Plasmodium vinckei TaxID=5860 RepID=A0A6V7SMT7_PLAVN|nr:V-type proton ATPase subunit G, putative [Plasmodium vinckei]
MAQNKGSNVLIQQLLKAEEEADLVIKKAKDVRAKMLKEAEATATEELKIFRAKEKEHEIKRYKDLFKKNKDQVAQFIYDKVFKVDIDIPDCVQKYM